MKTIPIGLAAKYAAGTARLCQCLRMERRDGFVVTLTSSPDDIVIGSERYLAYPGITPTDIAQSAGLAVDNLEIQFLKDDTYVNRADVLQGLWNKTAFHLFICDPSDPTAGVDTLMRGNLGDFEITRGGFRAELRSYLQLLQQPIGGYTSKTCRVRLGSQGAGMCNVNMAGYTFSSTLTSVTSRQVVGDTARLEASDYFGDGLFTFITGLLAGVSVKVKIFAGGQFTFALPTFVTPSIGDAYTVEAGCRKRHERTLANPSGVSDCIDKFNNILNFQGEPHLPGQDALTATP